MFETSELGRSLSKSEYKKIVPRLRTRLLRVQEQLAEQARFPVVILINGVEAAGKGEIINLLNEWMDARGIDTHAFDRPTEEASQRPRYWRYWMALPPAGRVGIFVGNWYTEPIIARAFDRATDAEVGEMLERVKAFERTLVDDGALLLKFWLHISKDRQLKLLKQQRKNPKTAWRVDKRDFKHAKRYDVFRHISERTLRLTSTGGAPWYVVEATDWRYRNVKVGELIVERVERHLRRAEHAERTRAIAPPVVAATPAATVVDENADGADAASDAHDAESPPPTVAQLDARRTVLDTIDLSLRAGKSYRDDLDDLQGRLNGLSRRIVKANRGAILLFEGSDAAGKGGAIRRITAALDARFYNIHQVAAPTDEEKAHHYLWRFWRHLPRLGRITIYDRSWYGRVLVERVERFASEDEWMRAYREICEFEKQLVDFGIVLVKFWLQISPDEQLRRFKLREQQPWKRYKLTAEDYRNREKLDLYERAANEMIERSSTEFARWTLVSAEDKRHARLTVLETVCQRLEEALER